MDNPRIQGIGKANPPLQLTQEETFRLVGYNNPRILKIFLNSGIDCRRFYLDPENFNRFETPDELNQRYLQGAMRTGCRAVNACLESAGMTPRDVDLFLVCTCTGYVCPDLGSRLIGTCDFAAMSNELPCSGWAAQARFPPFSGLVISHVLTPDG